MSKAGKKQKHWGWIILISLFLLAFIIGCKKEITEEEVWRRIREIETLEKTNSEKDIDRLIKIFKDEDELYAIRQAAAITLRNSNFNTPRLLHLYDGGGPPLERGFPKKPINDA